MTGTAYWHMGGLAIANMVLVVLIAPLLEGVVRKLRAVIQSRQGPPITQPYRDLLKLLIKEDLRVAGSPLSGVGPVVFFAAILSAAALMPLGARAASDGVGDIVAFVGLLALANLTLAGLGLASGSIFSSIGASREIMLVVTAEPVLVLALFVLALEARSLTFTGVLHAPLGVATIAAALVYLLALQVLVAKIPFDITEAETEVIGGPLAELSGPHLALAQWGIFAKQFIYSSLFVQLFVPWSVRIVPGLVLGAVLNVIWVFVLNLAVVGVVAAVNPRLRLDQAMRYGMSLAVAAAVVLVYASFAG